MARWSFLLAAVVLAASCTLVVSGKPSAIQALWAKVTPTAPGATVAAAAKVTAVAGAAVVGAAAVRFLRSRQRTNLEPSALANTRTRQLGTVFGVAPPPRKLWAPKARGRPKGAKDKQTRKKRGRAIPALADGDSNDEDGRTVAPAFRLPGARGPLKGVVRHSWTRELKGYALAQLEHLGGNARRTAKWLADNKPEEFGFNRGGVEGAAAISAVLLSNWRDEALAAKAANKPSWFTNLAGGARIGAGRPSILPAVVMNNLVATWESVVSTKKTLLTTSHLRSIAMGVVISMGYASVFLAKDRNGVPLFDCSRAWVSITCIRLGWRFRAPYGDAHKAPKNMPDLVWVMILRIAYFVSVYKVEKELVVNFDQTGIYFRQLKGGGWTSKPDETLAVDRAGDKRQLTLTVGCSAAGRTAPAQIIVEGSSMKSAPPVGIYKTAMVQGDHIPPGYKGYGGQVVKPDPKIEGSDLVPKWLTHIASTMNHWSDLVTTINILVFTIVPFLLAERARINKPEAHAVLILDCWWGWLSPIFIAYVRVNYPWIHLVFVPANCTPWAQPIDRGFVTWLKALLRWFSNELIMNMVLEQLNKEKRDPGSVNIDIYGAASCKKNLIIWVAAALAKMSEDTARVESYWTSVGKEPVFDEARAAGRFQTGILDAWRPNVQMEAVTRRNELFANLAMEQNGEKPSERSSAADFEELGWGDDAGLSAELQAAKLLLADPANPSRTTPLTELTVAQSDELHDLLLAAVEKHAKNVPPAADVAAVLQAAAAAADAGVLDFGEALADAPEQAELVEEEELPTPPSPPPASLTLDELHAVPRECFSRAMLDLLGDADECRVDAVVSQCAEYISAAGYAPLDTAVVVALLVGLMNTNRIMLNPELTMVYRLG